MFSGGCDRSFSTHHATRAINPPNLCRGRFGMAGDRDPDWYHNLKGEPGCDDSGGVEPNRGDGPSGRARGRDYLYQRYKAGSDAFRTFEESTAPPSRSSCSSPIPSTPCLRPRTTETPGRSTGCRLWIRERPESKLHRDPSDAWDLVRIQAPDGHLSGLVAGQEKTPRSGVLGVSQ